MQQDCRVQLVPREHRVLVEPLEVLDSKAHRALLEIRVPKAQLVRQARKETSASLELLELLVLPARREQLDSRDRLEIQGMPEGMVHKVELGERAPRVRLVILASLVNLDKLVQQVHQEIKDWLVPQDQ